MSTPRFTQAMLPRFKEIKPLEIEPFMRKQLKQNREKLDQLLNLNEPYTWENLIHPFEDMHDALNKYWSPIAHLHAVMETPALREAYNHVMPLLTEYHIALSQNEKFFQAVTAIAKRSDFVSLDPAQQKIIENEIRDFKLSGVHLPPEKKARMAALQQELSQLMTKFLENVLDATGGWFLHVKDENQLTGIPPQAMQLASDQAKERGLEGYVLTLDYPSYSTTLKFADKRSLRKTLYEAYLTRASDCGPNAGKWDNTEVMAKILKIRHEIAVLVDFKTYAHYSLATKMAKTPDNVLSFLNDLFERSFPVAEKEYQEVVLFARERDGISHLKAWDLAYYSEKLREAHFNFSPEELRDYFPIEKVLNGMFAIVNKLYGITIHEQHDLEVWHPDVRFFALYDAEELRGGFYIDLYARAHKRDGAWMNECSLRRKLLNQEVEYPVAYLTCNFMPPTGNQPARLIHEEVITLFHEFGHCLHHMLTKVNYSTVSGINGVPWDAVEFPSQFMENFCWQKESLDLLAAHYLTGEPLPHDLYVKMLSAKHFQTGLHMLRQLEFALFDFRLHLEYDPSQVDHVNKVFKSVHKKSVVPVASFNRFANSFSHIFGGSYAAGYYSYKWAEVLAADAFAQFEENGIFDRATGISFMQNILEIGGVRDPMLSFIAFRGRPPAIDALLKHNGIV